MATERTMKRIRSRMLKTSTKTVVRKRCAICRRFFIPKRSDCTTCSDECKTESRRRIRRKYEMLHRNKRAKELRLRRMEEMKHAYAKSTQTCLYCGRKLSKKRPSKEYCDYLCRQRMYRALANGETIPSELNESERRKILMQLDTRKHIEDKHNERLDWREDVERVLSLPAEQRWEHAKKWTQRERMYARSIELKRLGCESDDL